MTGAPELIADLQHVSVQRGSQVVLHDLALRIAAGESVAILGPNGCGKSTLIKVLTSELYPLVQPGMRARFFGRDRWDLTELRRRMGLVASDPPVRDALSRPGLEIVLSGFFSAARLWPNLHPTERMHEQAHRAMELLGVHALADRPLEQMSAGQQKRIMIARAWAAAGDSAADRVLLLDEPANALDIVAARQLRAQLSATAQAGTTLILVTHHVEDIVPEIDRVILMREGSIVADGPKRELLTTEGLSHLFNAPIHVSQTDNMYTAD